MVYLLSTHFRNVHLLRLHVFILSLHCVFYSHQQTIELFEYRQQDSDTKCTDGLLSDVDSVAFTCRVEYYQDPTMKHVFLLMKKTTDKIYILEKEYNIQTDCNDLNNSDCKHIDEHKVELKLHIKASKDISGARLRGKAITSSQRDIFSDDKIIPEVYDSKDHNVSLVINGEQQYVENDVCNYNVSESHFSISVLLESNLAPFFIEMSSKDPHIYVQGKGHVEYYLKINFSGSFNITIAHYPCRMESHKYSIRCHIQVENLSSLSTETCNCKLSIIEAIVLPSVLFVIIIIIGIYCVKKNCKEKHTNSTNPLTVTDSQNLGELSVTDSEQQQQEHETGTSPTNTQTQETQGCYTDQLNQDNETDAEDEAMFTNSEENLIEPGK